MNKYGLCFLAMIAITTLAGCGGGGGTTAIAGNPTVPSINPGSPSPQPSANPTSAPSSNATSSPTSTPMPSIQTNGYFPLANHNTWNYSCGSAGTAGSIVASANGDGTYTVVASIPAASMTVSVILSEDANGNVFISGASYGGNAMTTFPATAYLPNSSTSFASTFPVSPYGQLERSLVSVNTVVVPAGTWNPTLLYHDVVAGGQIDTFDYAHGIGPARAEIAAAPGRPAIVCNLTSYSLH